MYSVPAMAGRRAISRRQGRIVAAGGSHRQAAAQDDAERRAEVLHSLSDTHAGIVRKNGLSCGNRRAGTGLIHSGANKFYPQILRSECLRICQ